MPQLTQITLPRSQRAAIAKLIELSELATATEWNRAALVAALVEPGAGQGRRTSVDSDGSLMSATAFAALGIHGLTSATTVNIYARAWLDRLERPVLGRRVTLPTDPWPPTTLEDPRYQTVEDREAISEQATEDGTSVSKALDIAKNKRAMTAAIKASPTVARAAAEAIADRDDRADLSPTLTTRLTAASISRMEEVDRKIVERERRSPVQVELDVEGHLLDAARSLDRAIRRTQGIIPSESQRLMVATSVEMLQERVEALVRWVTGAANADWDADLAKLVKP